jgi:glutathione synthase/RimK-type ligase-like ATP-grasp enzyme
MTAEHWVALFGDLAQAPCAMLRRALDALGCPVLALDAVRDPPQGPDWGLGPDGRVTGTVRAAGRRWDLDRLTGLYLRPAAPRGSSPAAQARQAWTQHWIDIGELTDARVANRLSAMASNGSKPLQSQVLAACGFAVPPMLLTNDPQAVRRFEALHGPLIFKSASGVRSIVRPLDDAARRRLAAVAHAPVLFQKRMTGTNVRVHVVGEAVFATEIDSNGLDYRYAGRDGGHTVLRATTLPAELQARCRRAARALGLPFAGLDLMLGDDGQVTCFEANPSPAYSWYEDSTGQPIAAALARWLAGLAD